MQKIFLFVLLTFKTISSAPVSDSSKNCDFSTSGSCFKYIDDDEVMFRHNGARNYCESQFGGKLAILDSRHKMRLAIDFLNTRYQVEKSKGNGAPTAWVQGQVVNGTRHIEYENGVVNKHPHWLVPLPMWVEGKKVRFPTDILFGKNATCVFVSLWQPATPTTSERAGLYNVPCEGMLFSHPLCEINI